MPRHFVFALALVLAPACAFAANNHTCTLLQKLFEATDTALEDAAAGKARYPVSGIAVWTSQALEVSGKSSAKDALPTAVTEHLAAMNKAAKSSTFVADAAHALQKHGLVVWQAMPQICPKFKVPNFARHK